MTLDEFIKEQVDLLETFAREWKEQGKESPSTYPDDMPAVEWQEQYNYFVQDK